jgi:hypothetical protein
MREEWNQYMLEDGSVLRARLIVSEVLRLVDVYNAEGDPVYIIKSTNFVNSDVPANLRKKTPDQPPQEGGADAGS